MRLITLAGCGFFLGAAPSSRFRVRRPHWNRGLFDIRAFHDEMLNGGVLPLVCWTRAPMPGSAG